MNSAQEFIFKAQVRHMESISHLNWQVNSWWNLEVIARFDDKRKVRISRIKYEMELSIVQKRLELVNKWKVDEYNENVVLIPSRVNNLIK